MINNARNGFTISIIALPDGTTEAQRQAMIDGMLKSLPQTLGIAFELHGPYWADEMKRNTRDAGKLAQLRALVREEA